MGYYFLYVYKQYEIKQEIKQELISTLPLTSFQSFASDDRNIIWEEKDKEFSVDGKMYDVATTKIINGKKTYYCLSDEKETDLVNTYFKKNTSEQETSKQKRSKIDFQLQTIAFSQQEDILEEFCLINNKNKYPIICQNAISKCISVVSPPPKSL